MTDLNLRQQANEDFIIRVLEPLGNLVGFYRFRVEEDPLAKKFFQLSDALRNSTDDFQGESTIFKIFDCFTRILNIPDNIPYVTGNFKNKEDLLENVESAFQLIGFESLNEVLFSLVDKEKHKRAAEMINKAKSGELTESDFRKFYNCMLLARRNIPKKIEDLPEEQISKGLKRDLSKRYSYTYELLGTTFEALKETLGKGNEVPSKDLSILELFFRTNELNFLDRIYASDSTDEMIKSIIRDAVSTTLDQIKRQDGIQHM